jgi:hypothetical protein
MPSVQRVRPSPMLTVRRPALAGRGGVGDEWGSGEEDKTPGRDSGGMRQGGWPLSRLAGRDGAWGRKVGASQLGP